MSAAETFILFSVAGTTYALRSRDVAHVEMVEQVTAVTRELLDSLVTDAQPRDRETDIARRKERAAKRYAR